MSLWCKYLLIVRVNRRRVFGNVMLVVNYETGSAIYLREIRYC